MFLQYVRDVDSWSVALDIEARLQILLIVLETGARRLLVTGFESSWMIMTGMADSMIKRSLGILSRY